MMKNLPTAGRVVAVNTLERCCGFLGVFSLSVYCDGMQNQEEDETPAKKKKKKRTESRI
jgi:hypothetical protein